MAIHTLSTTQTVKGDLETIWSFFSDPRNLSRITPKEMGFEILSELPERMFPGMMIEYRVRPLLGIPMTWLTEITHVEEGRFFVDEQRVGPYAIWHHEHHFRDLGNGLVEMKDRVTYVPPFGILGEMVHPILIRPQLEKIFAHREKTVNEMFGSAGGR
ncbi:SRPBCC family protein [Phragmitibacter flavus]|uniref:SRPBCC family protein n=1 Tax=Phragmitibacter flavus TaxID=2576071 RepID=A0A5R8KJN5_9BACT|nr:SRPBCC family protein [Phragmitibacter flavus]TLD72502.1 SRPBCC family protein [Phragmitibacter flavus]